VTSGSDVNNVLENDAIWNVYNFFFHSKERMHEIKVWHKRSRSKRFGKSLGLRQRTRIIDENIHPTL
jgi:hypothetical protein